MARYFNAIEAMCKDGTYVPPEYLGNFETVASQADVLREFHGSSVKVVSGYRTPKWNKGADASQHLTASALDIRPDIVNWFKLPLAARTMHVREFYILAISLLRKGALPLVGGIGYYPAKWIHIDVRAKKSNGGLAWFAEARRAHLEPGALIA